MSRERRRETQLFFFFFPPPSNLPRSEDRGTAGASPALCSHPPHAPSPQRRVPTASLGGPRSGARPTGRRGSDSLDTQSGLASLFCISYRMAHFPSNRVRKGKMYSSERLQVPKGPPCASIWARKIASFGFFPPLTLPEKKCTRSRAVHDHGRPITCTMYTSFRLAGAVSDW